MSGSPLRLMGVGLSAMLVPLGSTMIAVALPAIGSEFDQAPADLTQWLVNSYLLVNIVALGPAGRLGDYWGYRNTLRLGQVLFGAGCLLPVACPLFAALVASRVLMALGGALMVPAVMAIFKVTVPADRLHRIFGYFGAMMGFAAALGPSLGGLLVHGFGWVSIFLMNLPPLALSAVLSTGFFKGTLHAKPEGPFKVDALGTLLMAAALACLVIGVKDRSALALAGLGLLALFAWWETKAPHPLVNLALFSQPSFAAGCAMVALLNLGMYALLFQLPFLLGLLYGWGPQRAGPFMTAFMVSMMAASALGGRLAEAAGVRIACVSGSLISAAAFALLSLLVPGEAEWHVAAALVLSGIGLGLANGPSQSAAMIYVDRAMSGVASGLLSTSRYLGGAIGISVLGLMLSGAVGGQSLARHHLATLLFAAALLVAAVVAFSLPGRVKH